MWDPRRLTILRDSAAYYRDNFTFYLYLCVWCLWPGTWLLTEWGRSYWMEFVAHRKGWAVWGTAHFLQRRTDDTGGLGPPGVQNGRSTSGTGPRTLSDRDEKVCDISRLLGYPIPAGPRVHGAFLGKSLCGTRQSEANCTDVLRCVSLSTISNLHRCSQVCASVNQKQFAQMFTGVCLCQPQTICTNVLRCMFMCKFLLRVCAYCWILLCNGVNYGTYPPKLGGNFCLHLQGRRVSSTG
jgi:hypothetical protein